MAELNTEQRVAIEEIAEAYIASQKENWKKEFLESVQSKDRDYIWSIFLRFIPVLFSGSVLAIFAVSLNIVYGYIKVDDSKEAIDKALAQIHVEHQKKMDDYLKSFQDDAQMKMQSYDLAAKATQSQIENVITTESAAYQRQITNYGQKIEGYEQKMEAEYGAVKAARKGVEGQIDDLKNLLNERISDIQKIDSVYDKSVMINHLTAYKQDVVKDIVKYIKSDPEFKHTVWQYVIPENIMLAIDVDEQCPASYASAGTLDPGWGDRIAELFNLVSFGPGSAEDIAMQAKAKDMPNQEAGTPTATEGVNLVTPSAIQLCRRS